MNLWGEHPTAWPVRATTAARSLGAGRPVSRHELEARPTSRFMWSECAPNLAWGLSLNPHPGLRAGHPRTVAVGRT